MTTKEVVIAKFRSVRERTLQFLEGCPPEAWEKYTLGRWHLHEVVAHLIGWSYESAIAMTELAANRSPSYDRYNQADDWAEINAIFVRKYGSKDFVDLAEKLRLAGVFVCITAEALPTEVFEANNGVWRKERQWTVYVELDDIADHERRHMEKVARALSIPLP